MHVGADQLRSVSASAKLDAALLLAKVLQQPRTYLICHPQQVLTGQQKTEFLQFIDRRCQQEPMAYILGYQEFWSLSLRCSPAALIPRPESELLVEVTINLPLYKQHQNNTSPHLLDLGTGTGALALAIAKEQPDWNITGVDNSPAAIDLAKWNRDQLKLHQVDFIMSNWFSALGVHAFDIILSNPPYIAAEDPHLANLIYEPQTALVAGDHGMADIEQIIRQAKNYLQPGGYLLLEHGYQQKLATARLLQQHGYQQIKQLKDMADNDRVSYGMMR